MVYKIVFYDTQSARFAWNFVKDFSVPNTYWWKSTVPAHRAGSIETEYAVVEDKLRDYGPSVPTSFTFRIRYQLMALVLEGTITPLKMIELISHVQRISRQHDADLIAGAIRRLGQQIQTPAPGVKAENFEISNLVRLLDESIEDSKLLEETSQDLTFKQKKHQHLALTYKVTVTPTGMRFRRHNKFKTLGYVAKANH
jgi:hypothetical protein